MEIVIICQYCNKKYYAKDYNTKVCGPLIRTVCSVCNKTTEKKLSVFAEEQTKTRTTNKFVMVNNAICFVRTLEKGLL